MLLGVVAIGVVLAFPQGLWGAFAARTGVRLFPVGHTVGPGQPPGDSSATRRRRAT